MSLFHVVVAVRRLPFTFACVNCDTLHSDMYLYSLHVCARVLSVLRSDMIYSLGLIYYKPTAHSLQTIQPIHPHIACKLFCLQTNNCIVVNVSRPAEL